MDTSPICIDIETAGLPNVADYLEPVQAARNLKDPEKIAADIAQRTEERDSKVGLDWNVGRIVALGWWTAQRGTEAYLCTQESSEAEWIAELWRVCRNRTIVTFNGRGFDLPFLAQRSRYLGIPHPTLDLRPYEGGRGNTDLWLELTFGRKDTPCMRTTLGAFCKRFGIPFDDGVCGKDIAALVAAGDWDAIEAHVRCDVEATVALARRLGVIQQQPEAVAI